MRRLISSGSPYEAKWGYSRAVVQGDWVFVAGTTGFDYATMTMPDDPAQQTRNTFATIEKALIDAGASLADLVRVTYYVPDLRDWEAIGAVAGEILAEVRPAATCVRAELVDPRMKVEIEATALKRG